MAALEGFWQIKTGRLISLSAQHLIDCDRGSHGCEGGFYSSAFKFETITHSGGVPSEDDYPYQESRQICRNDFIPSAGFNGFGKVPRGDEEQLLQAVAHQPIAAQIAASHEMMAFQGSEIYSGPCGPRLNHAVAIVGYGVSDDGKKYWIIKGSSGEEWAESGYMKLIRGTGSPGGYCSIHAGLSYFPTLTS
jgi:C1A family cysteine protease